MSCPYTQKDDHRVWQPRTAEEFTEAQALAGPKDPIWDWEGWRTVGEHEDEGDAWRSSG